jgi:hypothetical protein
VTALVLLGLFIQQHPAFRAQKKTTFTLKFLELFANVSILQLIAIGIVLLVWAFDALFGIPLETILPATLALIFSFLTGGLIGVSLFGVVSLVPSYWFVLIWFAVSIFFVLQKHSIALFFGCSSILIAIFSFVQDEVLLQRAISLFGYFALFNLVRLVESKLKIETEKQKNENSSANANGDGDGLFALSLNNGLLCLVCVLEFCRTPASLWWTSSIWTVLIWCFASIALPEVLIERWKAGDKKEEKDK